MTLKDMVVEVAPGVKYNTWAFDGHGAPGPGRPRPRGADRRDDAEERRRDPALDRLPRRADRPERRLQGRRAGGRRSRSASRPATRASTCTTAARSRCWRTSRTGCTARSSSRRRSRCRKADKEYVLVASEWYLNGDGVDKPASLDMTKARAMMPDWTTFNGYANQYVTHPLTAEAGRDRPLLRRRRRPDARHATSTSSGRSSTGPG